MISGESVATDPEAVTAGEPESPAALVERIRNKDPRAEAEVVQRYRRAVAIILERHTGGRPEAEDLFQDTFRVALEKLRKGDLRDPSRLPAFVARIARNLAIEHYRKIQRRRTDADSDALAAVPALGSGQLGELLERENASLVRRLIADLGTDRDREVLFRFYVAEEDKERIAADLGLSSLQFNRVLHRARQRYKTLYLARAGSSETRPAGPLATLGATIAILVTLLSWRGWVAAVAGGQDSP